ncbi:MAG: SAM-dependent methyltransferase [Negativicutes bacterium]|nr:SAM-dependent methyltransferase [Negativicutes bacterium]
MRYKKNEEIRRLWIQKTLSGIPAGQRILDAGAGERANQLFCKHLHYVSQDFCQYDGTGDENSMHTGTWNTKGIDLICDITAIPEKENSFDAILCSEVLEHLPEPTLALDEFARLLRKGGKLILTAPFVSWVHFAPFHYCSGFSRYWYEYHLPKRGLKIIELTQNGDWFALMYQEITRIGGMERRSRSWCWPLAYFLKLLMIVYFAIRPKKTNPIACFGWHCICEKE